MPSVNDPRHNKLMEQIDSFFSGRGFHVSEKTYHDGHIDRRAVDRLQLTFSPTALYIRASADRIAINPNDGMALYYEAKTGSGPDILAEALPLATHMFHGKRGVLCLYCCLDRLNNHRGFWAHDVPAFRVLFIPPQRESSLYNWYLEVLPPLFPGIPIAQYSVRGSNDPFVIIDQSIVAALPSWQELFELEQIRWAKNGNSAWERFVEPQDGEFE